MQQRNTLRVTPKGTHEKGATEQCGLTALSLEQAPTKLPISASKQSIMHVRLVWKGKVVSVSVSPRPDLRVHLQSFAIMVEMLHMSMVMDHEQQTLLWSSMLRPKCTRPNETVLGTRWDCQDDIAENGDSGTVRMARWSRPESNESLDSAQMIHTRTAR